MKLRLLSTSLLLFIFQFASAQLVEVPDKNFSQFLEQYFPDCMVDGKLDTNCKEVRKTKYMDVRGQAIKDLTGVEHFSKLERLWCSTNQIKKLEVNTLKSLRQLLCSNNQLQKLNLDGLSKLTLISCFNNQLTELNVSGAENLETIACDNNKLTELQLIGLPNLDHLNCRLNSLAELDLSKLSPAVGDHAILDCVTDNIELKGVNEDMLISKDEISGKDSKPYLHWLINRIHE